MTVLVVTFDEVTAIPRREDTKWLDEREVCPHVNRRAHGGARPADEVLFVCPSYFAGICMRAGKHNRVDCAFLDSAFDFHKAADWQEVAGGGMLYAPEQNPWKPRQTRGNVNGKR